MSGGSDLMAGRQRGAGLIEVAISVLVLGIGVLGLGSLQIAAKRMGYEAIQRSDASALAMDLLERLRANRAALPAYATTGIGDGGAAQLTEPPVACDGSRCSAAEMGAWDLWQWQQALDGAGTGAREGGLVRPTACVTVTGRRVAVEIAWQGFRPLSLPAQESRCGAGNYGADDADRQWLRMSSWIGAQ